MTAVTFANAGGLLHGSVSARLWNAVSAFTLCASVQPVRASPPVRWPFPAARRKAFFHSTVPRHSSRRISYRIAVSATGKDRVFRPDTNIFNFDPTTHDALGIQTGRTYHERKRSRPDSGEDAFFVSKVNGDTDAVAFGVADGVGGWASSGVDPADFSHSFCSYMAQAARDWNSEADRLRARALMQMGYDRCIDDKSIYAGGSTANVAVARGDGKVELANLGDSGSILFRLAAVHHYSTSQTHGFNTPYQLSVMPPRMRAQSNIFGGKAIEDLPYDASVTHCTVQHGDVLLLATDGVLDNLFNQDILNLVTSRMMATGAWNTTSNTHIGVSDELDSLTRPGGLSSLISSAPRPSPSPSSSPSPPPDPRTREHTLQALLAAAVARQAKMSSMDLRHDGPFAKESRRYHPWDPWRGGKVDDISVIVAIAVEEGRDEPKDSEI
ncbi:hypothetical protein AJ80_09025 [Polytolypa hystricis UAMH7299]|uniref:Protein phosphatase n=1 Tax=Polytolypa hystricis (strain UAMH7299) TaxID=1447883 RepID=A0A2B7WXC8_POLH7|nr:hypothetical protein AJ80_09025 [Polytolypa hystricis UAMH7299]